MSGKKGSKLSIFKTFKTKNRELTGEAIRQRSILTVLATLANPADRTRTAISQRIAAKNSVIWKNIYSGIFRDLDEVLIPLDLVQEEGRLPLKRGPKALQEMGIPYYRLTARGLLVCLSLDEIGQRGGIIDKFFAALNPEERSMHDVTSKFSKIAPRFTYSLFEKHARAYCDGTIEDLLPLDIANFRHVSDESVLIIREFVEGFAGSSKDDRAAMMSFLDEMTG